MPRQTRSTEVAGRGCPDLDRVQALSAERGVAAAADVPDHPGESAFDPVFPGEPLDNFARPSDSPFNIRSAAPAIARTSSSARAPREGMQHSVLDPLDFPVFRH